jgi:hypothetical protein
MAIALIYFQFSWLLSKRKIMKIKNNCNYLCCFFFIYIGDNKDSDSAWILLFEFNFYKISTRKILKENISVYSKTFETLK